MVIPQGMAYGMLAGLPPIYGLYASLVPLFLYAVLGTSKQMMIGPAAMIALLVAAGVGELAEPDTALYIKLAITLTFAVGILKLLMGFLRLGFMMNFLSHPVLTGFTSAAAIIICFSQFKYLLGINMPNSQHVVEIITTVAAKIQETHAATLMLGLGGIAVILICKRIHRSIPGALMAVILSIIIMYFGQLDQLGINIVGTIPKGLPVFALPDLSIGTLIDLMPVALTIALIGVLESVAIARVMQVKHKTYEIDVNQEIRAIGFANTIGALFQSIPVAGSFTRTAVNDQAGAKSGISAAIAVLLVALTLLFLTPLFYYLPRAILASIIIVAVFKLIDIKEARFLWRSDKLDFTVLVATFLATLIFGIKEGVILGVMLSLIMIIYKASQPHIAQLGKLEDTNHYLDILRFPELNQRPDILIARIDSEVFFANTALLKDTIMKLARKKKELKYIIINAEGISSLDSSAIHMFNDLVSDFEQSAVKIIFTGTKGAVRDAMYKGDILHRLDENHFFLSIQNAIDYIDGNMKHVHGKYAFQSDARDRHKKKLNK
jgi:SulP family sulfate permease